MKPVRYHSLKPYAPSFSSFFDDFFTKNISEFVGHDYKSSIPAINILEDEDHYTIELAAPGLQKSDFNIKVENNHLVVSVEKDSDQEANLASYRRQEFSYYKFQRKFFLPKGIKKDKINASYDAGILSVNLPKSEDIKAIARTIEIK